MRELSPNAYSPPSIGSSRFRCLAALFLSFNEPVLREVVESPYRIVYRMRADVLEIITVVHAARRFPTDLLRAQL